MGNHRPGVLTTLSALAVSATVGATARYYMTLWAAAQWGNNFPYGTLLVNVLGSLIVGSFLTLYTHAGDGDPVLRLIVATGFCGSFTTFSTFSYETFRLLGDGRFVAATVNILGSMALGLVGVAMGGLATRYLLG